MSQAPLVKYFLAFSILLLQPTETCKKNQQLLGPKSRIWNHHLSKHYFVLKINESKTIFEEYIHKNAVIYSGGEPVHARVLIHAHPKISPKQSQLHYKLPMYMINLIIIYVVVNIFSMKNNKSLRILMVGVNRYMGVNWSTTRSISEHKQVQFLTYYGVHNSFRNINEKKQHFIDKFVTQIIHSKWRRIYTSTYQHLWPPIWTNYSLRWKIKHTVTVRPQNNCYTRCFRLMQSWKVDLKTGTYFTYLSIKKLALCEY